MRVGAAACPAAGAGAGRTDSHRASPSSLPSPPPPPVAGLRLLGTPLQEQGGEERNRGAARRLRGSSALRSRPALRGSAARAVRQAGCAVPPAGLPGPPPPPPDIGWKVEQRGGDGRCGSIAARVAARPHAGSRDAGAAPSLFSVAPPSGQASPAHPRWPEGTGDTGQPLSNNHTIIRAPRASRCAPHSVGSGSCPRGCPRCGVPKAPKGPPRPPPGSAVPRGAAGLGFAPGAAPGALCELPKVSSCRQGNLFGRAVKKKKKAAHMHSSRHSPAHRFPAPGRDARVSAAHLPQPETDLFFIFQGPEHREPAGHLSISPRRGALGDATKISRAGSRLCPRAGAERARFPTQRL